MARKLQQIQDASSDDDAPETVSHATSRANAKRDQKALHDFTIEERARKKARNQERDQKLKERARANKGGKTDPKSKAVRFAQEGDEDDEDEDGDDSVEARMLRAMRDAADEVESEGKVAAEDDDDDGEFKGLGFEGGIDLGDDMAFEQSESDEEADMSFGEDEWSDPEAPMDEEDMDEDGEDDAVVPSAGRVDYLADDLFAAAFASQKPVLPPSKAKKTAGSTQKQTTKKRQRNSVARPKDLVVGGRTIRTLLPTSDPRSQATARSIPSARVRKFVDQSLALKGKRVALKAKKKGWERRPANVGVMKSQGAPHGFVRSTR